MAGPDPKRGLVWDEDMCGPVARFAYEPDLAAAEQMLKSLLAEPSIKLSPLSEGAHNKVYDVTFGDDVDDHAVDKQDNSIDTPPEGLEDLFEQIDNLDLPESRSAIVSNSAEQTNNPILNESPSAVVTLPQDNLSLGNNTASDGKTPAYSAGQTDALVLRVALPLNPRHKTISEVATMSWVRQNTDIPVPVVVAYDATNSNPVGFEWILMTKIPGKPLCDVWKTLPLSATENIVKQVAGYTAALFKHRLSGIGSIHDPSSSTVGKVVYPEMEFPSSSFYDIPKGPFLSSGDWLESIMALHEQECRSVLVTFADGSDEGEYTDNAKRGLKMLDKLRPIVRTIFPIDQRRKRSESSFLQHHDLHPENIFLDDSGVVTGVIDWEFMIVVPLWMASADREDLFGHGGWGWKPKTGEGPSRHHWRDLFVQEMTNLSLEWKKLRKSSSMTLLRKLKRAIDQCIQLCKVFRDWRMDKDIDGWISQFKEDWQESDWREWQDVFGLDEFKET